MQREAGAIGLAFERVAAVDGANVPDWLKGQFLNADGSPLSRLAAGEIGCYASHLTVHDGIVREGLPYALVLEDDVKLAPDLMDAAMAAVSAAPAEWDYIHLSGRIKRTVYSLAQLPNGRHLVRHMRVPMNTGGYIISGRGAEKMLAPAPRIRPIDQEVHFPWLRSLDVLGVYPSPVIWGDHLPTTIECTWRTEPKKKHSWGPGFASRLRGHVYAAGKLGLVGYLACRWAGIRFAVARRGSAQGQVPIPVVRARHQATPAAAHPHPARAG